MAPDTTAKLKIVLAKSYRAHAAGTIARPLGVRPARPRALGVGPHGRGGAGHGRMIRAGRPATMPAHGRQRRPRPGPRAPSRRSSARRARARSPTRSSSRPGRACASSRQSATGGPRSGSTAMTIDERPEVSAALARATGPALPQGAVFEAYLTKQAATEGVGVQTVAPQYPSVGSADHAALHRRPTRARPAHRRGPRDRTRVGDLRRGRHRQPRRRRPALARRPVAARRPAARAQARPRIDRPGTAAGPAGSRTGASRSAHGSSRGGRRASAA